jgi:hypothetical protein
MNANRLRLLLAALGLGFLAVGLTISNGPVAIGLPDGPGAPTVEANPALVKTYQATITEDELRAHVEVLASDAFGGRRSTLEGQRLAAEYIASTYRDLGLGPANPHARGEQEGLNAYYLPFEVLVTRVRKMVLRAELSDGEYARSIFGGGKTDGQSYVAKGSRARSAGSLIFAGYGIRDGKAGYDDYAVLKDRGIDIRGSWLMVLDGEPTDGDGRSLITGDDTVRSDWSVDGETKQKALFRLAAPRGMLIVDHRGVNHERSFVERTSEAEELAIADISLGYDVRIPSSMPVVVVTESFANRLLEPDGRTVEDLVNKIASQKAPEVFRVEGVELTAEISLASEKRITENVAAVLEGSDPLLKSEHVLLSSHYDHEGIVLLPGSDRIKNGADDNASGTAAALEIAEAFAKARDSGAAPRRSIIFLHFAGEEEGLLGSEYYADIDPVQPLSQAVAVVNADMIGRTDPSVAPAGRGYIDVIGARLSSSDLESAVVRVNELTGLDFMIGDRYDRLSDPNQYFKRSDHWNLGKHGVPYLFFFAGTHEDYHRVGDESHKVEYPELAQAARLIFGTVWEVAARTERPAADRMGL